jgi:DNA-binding IclR family transcriptional regulator
MNGMVSGIVGYWQREFSNRVQGFLFILYRERIFLKKILDSKMITGLTCTVIRNMSPLYGTLMKSLIKVLDIIDAVAEEGKAGIRELASQLGFPPSTIHRILSTLVARGYFSQDPATKQYALSVRFLELGTMVQDQFHLTSIARPHLKRLMLEAKESVNLAIQAGDKVVYLDHVKSDYSMLRLFTRPGAQAPLYCTGVGKLFLSRMDERELDTYLRTTERIPFTPHTLVDAQDIRMELQQIRNQGYSVDNEEMEEGVRCVGSLIMDHTENPAGAVSISGAAMRITADRIELIGKMVKECTREISMQMGFRSETLRDRERRMPCQK